QEAHEAIRPAGDRFRTPSDVKNELDRDELGLYELIWRRTIASQMVDAKGRTVSIRIGAVSSGGREAVVGGFGAVIRVRGFRVVYEEGRDDEDDGADPTLPDLKPGDRVEVRELEPQGHQTSPPPRYTEATLVKALEERGIGRPSTYASILATIL